MYQEHRQSRFQILPTVIKNILIINVLLFIAKFVLGEKFNVDLDDILGLHYPGSGKFKVYQLVTHMFMHADLSHIFFNMLGLVFFGAKLEHYWGGKRFLLYYMVTGLGAAALHLFAISIEVSKIQDAIEAYAAAPNVVDFKMLLNQFKEYKSAGHDAFRAFFETHASNTEVQQQSVQAAWQLLVNKMSTVTIGASGAVFGILLGFGLLFPNTMLSFYFFPVPVEAKYVVTLFGLGELYTLFRHTPGDNIAHFAHLGGMLFGYILIKLWNRYNRKTLY
jgi:membrane associated rhomboid family serine protease